MMTPNEICREYRQAKDKKTQINILADLNCVDKDEIIKVLVDCGEMEMSRSKSRKEKQIKSLVVTEAVAEVLYNRMDELNALMKPLENQLESLKNEYKEIAAFVKGGGKKQGDGKELFS